RTDCAQQTSASRASTVARSSLGKKGLSPPRLANGNHGGLVRPPQLASRLLPLRAPPAVFGGVAPLASLCVAAAADADRVVVIRRRVIRDAALAAVARGACVKAAHEFGPVALDPFVD